MKLLSLWEPWATLMALGAKRIETRSWSTGYRGWLAIHAAKGGLPNEELFNQCCSKEFREVLRNVPEFARYAKTADALYLQSGSAARLPCMRKAGVFPFGCIVAVVRLEDCLPTEDRGCLPGVFSDYPALETPQELEFGNYYESGRWAWVTTDLFRLPNPIPFKGKQGLIDVPSDTLNAIREQWRTAMRIKATA